MSRTNRSQSYLAGYADARRDAAEIVGAAPAPVDVGELKKRVQKMRPQRRTADESAMEERWPK